MQSESKDAQPTNRSIPIFLIGLLLGVVGAAVVSYLFVDRPGSDSKENESRLISGVYIDDDTGTVVVELDVDGVPLLLRDESSFERSITLHNLTQRADTRKLLGLFAHFESFRPVRLRDEVQSALVRQLARMEPINTLDNISTLAEVRQSPMVDVVFQEWSVINLQESLEFASNLELPYRKSALEGILRSRVDLSDEERRKIAQQLDEEQVILDQWAVLKLQDGIDDPSSEWSKFVTIHGGDVDSYSFDQLNLLASIARSWIGRDGIGGMTQHMSSSLEDYDASVSLISLLLEEVVIDNPGIVLESATSMDSEVRSIVMNALAKLAERDPEGAYKIASMMEASSDQVALQRAVINSWIEADPKAALEARSSLSENFRPWIEQSALMSMVRTLPEEVPPFVPTITNKTQLEIVVINLSLNWARKDPRAVFEWLQSEPAAKPWYGNVLHDVIENLTRKNAEEAIRFALEQPPREYDEVGWESVVVWSVAHSDIDAAVGLIDHARDEKTRETMLRSIGQVLINQAQYERAMNWAKNLKEEKRQSYYEDVVVSWAGSNPEQLYQKIDGLPSVTLKSVAAETLISYNEFQKAFTDEQIEDLKKHLPSEESIAP